MKRRRSRRRLTVILVIAMIAVFFGWSLQGTAYAASNVMNQDGMGFSGSVQANVLTGNITMESHNLPPGTSVTGAFASGVFDGENVWLIPYSADRVVKINSATGSTTSYTNWPAGYTKPTSAFVGGVFDGQYIWLVPSRTDKVIKIEKTTGAMTAYNLPANTGVSDRFYGSIFDGQNIWLIPHNSPSLVKINKDTGTMTAYTNWPSGFTKGNNAFSGGIFDGRNIWMIPFSATHVVKMDTVTETMTGYNSWPAGFTKGTSAFIGGAYDGTNIWLIPANADRLIRMNTSNGGMAGYTNWPAGFTKPASSAFAGGIYDGRNIWLVAGSADRVVRFDTTTETMTGYNNWPSGFMKGTAAFRGGVYDGRSIWMVPAGADRVVRVAGESIPSYTVTFNSNGGSPVSDQTVASNSVVDEPTAPTKTGSTFDGWYSDAGLTTPFDFTAPITGNMMLYAKWIVNVTSVVLDHTSLSLTVGGADGMLTATVTPADATNKAVTWSSSNSGVATVANGVVTPVGAGTATITATTVDGGYTATCEVTVNAATVPVSNVTVNKDTLVLRAGGMSETLLATVEPNTADQAVQWSSSDLTVATVSSAGVVTPVSAGTAIITVASEADPTKKATCSVLVRDILLGDVNMDGWITSADAFMVQRFLKGTLTLTDLQKDVANVNLDGDITKEDSDLIVSRYLGKILNFPRDIN